MSRDDDRSRDVGGMRGDLNGLRHDVGLLDSRAKQDIILALRDFRSKTAESRVVDGRVLELERKLNSEREKVEIISKSGDWLGISFRPHGLSPQYMDSAQGRALIRAAERYRSNLTPNEAWVKAYQNLKTFQALPKFSREEELLKFVPLGCYPDRVDKKFLSPWWVTRDCLNKLEKHPEVIASLLALPNVSAERASGSGGVDVFRIVRAESVNTSSGFCLKGPCALITDRGAFRMGSAEQVFVLDRGEWGQCEHVRTIRFDADKMRPK